MWIIMFFWPPSASCNISSVSAGHKWGEWRRMEAMAATWALALVSVHNCGSFSTRTGLLLHLLRYNTQWKWYKHVPTDTCPTDPIRGLLEPFGNARKELQMWHQVQVHVDAASTVSSTAELDQWMASGGSSKTWSRSAYLPQPRPVGRSLRTCNKGIQNECQIMPVIIEWWG